jgi:hypothetical protein
VAAGIQFVYDSTAAVICFTEELIPASGPDVVPRLIYPFFLVAGIRLGHPFQEKRRCGERGKHSVEVGTDRVLGQPGAQEGHSGVEPVIRYDSGDVLIVGHTASFRFTVNKSDLERARGIRWDAARYVPSQYTINRNLRCVPSPHIT